MGNADLRPAFHKTARKGARRRGCERQPARGPPASVLPSGGENTREAQSLTPGRVRGGRRRGRPSARRRHQLCLSALGVTQSQLGCARAYQDFKDLPRRVRSLPRLPTLLFGNSSNSPEVLRSSRKCARNAASGDWLLMGRPSHLPAAGITSRVGWSVLRTAQWKLQSPRVCQAPRVEEDSRLWRLPDTRTMTGRVVYVTRGRNVAATCPGLSLKTTCECEMPKLLFWILKEEAKS